MTRPISTVFFDLHGTLVTFDVDDVDARIEAAYAVYAAGPHSPAPWRDFLQTWKACREPLEKIAREAHRELQIVDVVRKVVLTLHGGADEVNSEVVEQMVRAYTGVWIRNLALSPGAKETLSSLKPKYRLALVSNYSDTATVWRILELFALKDFFDAVVVSAEVGWRKPHPAIFLEALRRTRSLPEATVHIGDEPHHDIVGATRVGLVGILYDPHDRYPAHNGCRVQSLLEVHESIQRLEDTDGPRPTS